MNPIARALVGTPLASATSSSTEAKSRGRYIAASSSRVIAPMIAVSTKSPVLMPKTSPKRIEYASVA